MTSSDNVATVAWLNNRLMLDIVQATRSLVLDDIVSVVILAAINNANTSYLDARPDLASHYMGIASVDDAMCRPASVSALARSLGVPRETARGKALELERLGLIRAEPGGFVLPARMMLTQPFDLVVAEYFRAIGAFIEGLGRLEVFDLSVNAKLATPFEAFGGGVVRLVGAHMLRAIGHAMELAPDLNLTSAYVLDATTYLTGAHLMLQDGALPELVGEARTGAVRGAAVAEFLNMPQETVRRHLKKLTETGRLQLASDGYSVRLDDHRCDVWADLQGQAFVNTRQLIWKLNAVGALAA